MANQLLTISMITADAARILSNNLVLAKCVNRDYDDDFAIKGAKIGQTLNVRKPARYNARIGTVVDIQAQTETYAPLTFTNPIGVDVAFTSQEMTFTLEDFAHRFIKPAVVRIANEVDAQGYALVNNSFMYVNVPGTALTTSSTPTARQAILQAAAKLYDNDAPLDSNEMHFISGTAFNAVLADSASTLFNPSTEISDVYVKGQFGEFGGFKQYMAQLVPAHTNGAYSGSPITAGVGGQTGATINSDGWGSGVTNLKAGDIITFAGVYGVNPQTKAPWSYLQPFTLTADVSDSSGAVALPVSPAVVASGPYQNVSQSIPDEATITVIGATGVTSQQAFGFHRDAIMLANQELVTPGNVESAAYIRDDQTKIGVRFASQWDIRTNQHIQRFDTMIAWASLYPQLSCRVFTS
jgi:hypothetical protein